MEKIKWIFQLHEFIRDTNWRLSYIGPGGFAGTLYIDSEAHVEPNPSDEQDWHGGKPYLIEFGGNGEINNGSKIVAEGTFTVERMRVEVSKDELEKGKHFPSMFGQQVIMQCEIRRLGATGVLGRFDTCLSSISSSYLKVAYPGLSSSKDLKLIEGAWRNSNTNTKSNNSFTWDRD